MRFKSVEEARRYGINVDCLDLKKDSSKARKDKRTEIVKLIDNIRSSNYSFDYGDNDSYILTIEGFAAPSWNKMIRLNYRMYSSYSKAIKDMILKAGFDAKVLRKYKVFNKGEPVSVNIHCERKRLLDLDNVCAKQIIDGVVSCGILFDDNPEYIKSYHATQVKSKINRTTLTLSKV